MDTPIFDFVQELINNDTTRLFMPGHKGKSPIVGHPFSAIYPYDITEITGADVLFSSDGIIKRSQRNAAKLFGSRTTLYSTGGSTLCIKAMVMLASRKTRKIIAGRNAHVAFINACILLDIEPVWVLSKENDRYGVCGLVTADEIEQALADNPQAGAVYITSPDYLGNVSDIAAISAVCRKHNAILICDNAHGAYLRFCGNGENHPLSCGATMCCDSAHKTLPVLTGGAYLHLCDECEFSEEDACEAMKMFATTSPSYLILQSLDLCNLYLDEKARGDYRWLHKQMSNLKAILSARNINYLENTADFSKLTIDIASTGLSTEELGGLFTQNNIEWEYKNNDYIVLLFSPATSESDFVKLSEFFLKLSKAKKDTYHYDMENFCKYSLPESVMSPRKAYFKKSVLVTIEMAVGKISAQTVAICPPGVPIIVPGEKISQEIKNICKNAGNLSVKVLE